MAIICDNVLYDCAAVIVGALTVLYFVLTRNFGHWKNKGVPYLKPNIFFGNCKKLFFLEMSPGQFLKEVYDQSKGNPYVGFFIFGRPALVLRDPEVIKDILIRDFNKFGERHADIDPSVDPVGAKTLFVIKGHKWQHMRSLLTPTFSAGKVKQMYDLLITQCAEDLRNFLHSTNGEIEDVKEVMANYTTDVISSCAFGIESNCIKDPNAEFRKFGKKVFEFSNFRAFEFMSIFFVPTFVKLGRFHFLSKEATDFLRKTFWDALLFRQEKKIVRNDLIDLLIKLKNEADPEYAKTIKNGKRISELVFSKDELVAQAAQFFAAGFETTGSTISFALYELAMNPKCQSKLRQELANHLKTTDGKITFEVLNGMKYLDMVVSETMRKYPPLPFLDRIALDDYTIAGTKINIEKGTPVFIPLLGLHYDTQYFPAPERFDPERFNDENKSNIPSAAYLPFGDGPRNCLGSRFGLVSAKTGLVYALSQFEFRKCQNTPKSIEIEAKAVITSSIGAIPLSVIESDISKLY